MNDSSDSASQGHERISVITQVANQRLLSWRKRSAEPLSEYLSRLGNRASYKSGTDRNVTALDTVLEKGLLPLGMAAYSLRLKLSAARARSLNGHYQYCCCTDVHRLATSFKADTKANMTLEELQQSAQRGCTRCWLIVECIMKYADEWYHAAPSNVIVTGSNDLVRGTGSIAVFTVFWVDLEVAKIYKGPPKWRKLELEIYSDEGETTVPTLFGQALLTLTSRRTRLVSRYGASEEDHDRCRCHRVRQHHTRLDWKVYIATRPLQQAATRALHAEPPSRRGPWGRYT